MELIAGSDTTTGVLGGAQTFHVSMCTAEDMIEAIEKGFPKVALRNTAKRVFTEPGEAMKFVYRIVPEATYKRRTRLTPAESERTERLARVIAQAEHVWDDRESAQEWLLKPHPELRGKEPIYFAMTELCARRVEELLNTSLHGLPV